MLINVLEKKNDWASILCLNTNLPQSEVDLPTFRVQQKKDFLHQVNYVELFQKSNTKSS